MNRRTAEKRKNPRRSKRQIWTAAEIADLRRLYPTAWPRYLERHFGRSIQKIHAAAAHYDIKKARDFLRNVGRITASHPRAVAARFSRGHVPANKGLRRPGWFRGRMRETQFKKGNRPHTWLPVGTIELNTDGYLRMKVRDDPERMAGVGASTTNWMFIHRMVWESAHGPIPSGHRIWWKDGNHLNCALENLELRNGREHMAQTTIHNLPDPLKQVIYLNAALKRRIRRIEEHGEESHFGSAGSSV